MERYNLFNNYRTFISKDEFDKNILKFSYNLNSINNLNYHQFCDISCDHIVDFNGYYLFSEVDGIYLYLQKWKLFRNEYLEIREFFQSKILRMKIFEDLKKYFMNTKYDRFLKGKLMKICKNKIIKYKKYLREKIKHIKNEHKKKVYLTKSFQKKHFKNKVTEELIAKVYNPDRFDFWKNYGEY